MFGENKIIGEKIVKVNSSNNITLPKFTGVETGDDLVIVKLFEEYIIYRSEYFQKLINILKERLKSAPTLEEKLKIKQDIRAAYYSILREVICNNKRSISLPPELRCNEIKCIGKNKGLVLKPIVNKKED